MIPGGLSLDGTFHRSSNPMAGSFTAYHNFTMIAKRDIVAGEELFVDRGARHNNQVFNFSSKIDFEGADSVVSELLEANLQFTEAQWIGTE